MMIVITGLVFPIPLFLYSCFLHERKIKAKRTGLAFTLMIFWFILCLIPIAIFLQSTFVGFIVLALFFHFLGFRTFFFGLGVALGWRKDHEMELSFVTSGFIIAVYAVLRKNLGYNHLWLLPFGSAICTLGGNIFYLSQLILSAKWDNHGKSYEFRNGFMIISMITGLGIGSIY